MTRRTRGKNEPPKDVVLDRFSDADLRVYKKKSDEFQKYHTELYYFLEAQRHLHAADIRSVLCDTEVIDVNETGWRRVVPFQYAFEALSPKGSLKKGGRFNVGKDLDNTSVAPFPVFYAADCDATAYREAFGEPVHPRIANGLSGHEMALTDPDSYLSMKLKIKASNIFNLRKTANLKKVTEILSSFQMPSELQKLAQDLGVRSPWIIRTPGEMKQTLLEENWRFHPMQLDLPSNSQTFGKMLKDAGFNGVMYPSSRRSEDDCLAFFVENFDGSDVSITITNPPKDIEHTLNSETWKKLTYGG